MSNQQSREPVWCTIWRIRGANWKLPIVAWKIVFVLALSARLLAEVPAPPEHIYIYIYTSVMASSHLVQQDDAYKTCVSNSAWIMMSWSITLRSTTYCFSYYFYNKKLYTGVAIVERSLNNEKMTRSLNDLSKITQDFSMISQWSSSDLHNCHGLLEVLTQSKTVS